MKEGEISLLKAFNYVYPERCEAVVIVYGSCCIPAKCCWNGVVCNAELYLLLVMQHYLAIQNTVGDEDVMGEPRIKRGEL